MDEHAKRSSGSTLDMICKVVTIESQVMFFSSFLFLQVEKDLYFFFLGFKVFKVFKYFEMLLLLILILLITCLYLAWTQCDLWESTDDNDDIMAAAAASSSSSSSASSSSSSSASTSKKAVEVPAACDFPYQSRQRVKFSDQDKDKYKNVNDSASACYAACSGDNPKGDVCDFDPQLKVCEITRMRQGKTLQCVADTANNGQGASIALHTKYPTLRMHPRLLDTKRNFKVHLNKEPSSSAYSLSKTEAYPMESLSDFVAKKPYMTDCSKDKCDAVLISKKDKTAAFFKRNNLQKSKSRTVDAFNAVAENEALETVEFM